MRNKQPKVVRISAAPKKAKETIKALVAECLARRIRPTLKMRSKHMRMEYSYRGQHRIVPLSCTPGDRRAINNALGDFRRQIREIDRCAA